MAHLETEPRTRATSADGDRLRLSFGGSAVREIRGAAHELGITPQRFVARAVSQALKILSMQRKGYTVILRDQRGVEFDMDF